MYRLYAALRNNIKISKGNTNTMKCNSLMVIKTSAHTDKLGGTPIFRDARAISPEIIIGNVQLLFNMSRECED